MGRFEVQLPVPPTLRPVRTDANTDYYEVVQRRARREILPGLKTTVWGYNGAFPGPTIRARRGRRVVVRHANRLDVPTVVHLHGGRTPSEHDGFPMDLIRPGRSRTYVYPNEQRPATLWYHDHAMDRTGPNVWMGLAGMYILEDELEDRLPLPKGEHDVPLIIQGRKFGPDGELVYSTDNHDGAPADTVLVNGAPWPRMEVARRKYRFRILNACNANILKLALSTDEPFVQIGTDGGLLPAPVRIREIPLAEAERVEVVIDFAEYPIGTKVVLQDLKQSIGGQRDLMRFDVAREARDDSLVPGRLREVEPIPEGEAVRTRQFAFDQRIAFKSLTNVDRQMTIDNKPFDPDRVDADPRLGDVEIWKFQGGDDHTAHVHLVQFQVVSRNGQPPGEHERGWKDTVQLGGEVSVIARFEGYRGKYVLHCHNLEHEDHYMMARFDVV